jgi:hypothetical protein
VNPAASLSAGQPALADRARHRWWIGVSLDAVACDSCWPLMRSANEIRRVREAPRQRYGISRLDISWDDTRPLRAGTEKPRPSSDQPGGVEGSTQE